MNMVWVVLLPGLLSNTHSHPTLTEMRGQYTLAVSNKKVCKEMIDGLQAQAQHGVCLAYLGAFQAIWANHTWDPFEKLSTFNRGRKNIERAVEECPNEMEVHFIRLSIQYNVPKILCYYTNILPDKSFVLSHYKNIEAQDLRVLIMNFFETSHLLTESEKANFRQ